MVILIDYPYTIQFGTLVRRYKRFFVDIVSAVGEEITLHCPNTGALSGCLAAGNQVAYTLHRDPKKKLPGTLELIRVRVASDDYWVGVNTQRANHLVHAAWAARQLPIDPTYDQIKREVVVGGVSGMGCVEDTKTRIDFCLRSTQSDLPNLFVEVKSVTYAGELGTGYFPDAPTSRGVKHLRTLTQLLQAGYRATLVYCVQHEAITEVAVADWIDPYYQQAMVAALAQGLEVIVFRVKFESNRQVFDGLIPFSQVAKKN